MIYRLSFILIFVIVIPISAQIDEAAQPDETAQTDGTSVRKIK